MGDILITGEDYLVKSDQASNVQNFCYLQMLFITKKKERLLSGLEPGVDSASIRLYFFYHRQ